MDSAKVGPTRIIALTPQGAALARRLARELPGSRCWLPLGQGAAAGEQAFHHLSEVFQAAFAQGENLVCIMAAGIVVRHLAPYLKGKAQDPAVVVVDEAGQFAISLLSGHLGGANELARRVARLLGATPVITTASDVHGLPALDLIAASRGLTLENLPMVRRVQMAVLQGQPVRLLDPHGYLAEVAAAHPGLFEEAADLEAALTAPGPTVYVGFRERTWPADWLILRPRNLVAGMGCHKGTPPEEILAFIKNTFAQERLSLLSLGVLATIAAKKDEPGLIEAARRLGVEFLWFTATELQAIPVPHPSAQVARHLGVESVSEAAALKAGGWS